MDALDPDDPRPPYEQLADALRTRIRSAALGPGAQLPSYHALAVEFGVAPNTVKSALAALRREGLIVSRVGKGSFVRTQPPARAEDQGPSTESAAGDNDIWAALSALTQRVAAIERRLHEG